MPQMHSDEFLVFERLHRRQNKVEHQHQLATLHKQPLIRVKRLIGRLGKLIIALGTRMQRVEQSTQYPV